MTDPVPDAVKRALEFYDATADDLALAGGFLRCGTCGARQPVGDVASHLSSGWPQHCGTVMTWVTLRELLAEQRRPLPEGFELAAVESADWRVETGHRCSYRRCHGPCVAAFNRRRRKDRWNTRLVDVWHRYCISHLYGNWIENGKVMHWILREAAQ